MKVQRTLSELIGEAMGTDIIEPSATEPLAQDTCVGAAGEGSSR